MISFGISIRWPCSLLVNHTRRCEEVKRLKYIDEMLVIALVVQVFHGKCLYFYVEVNIP